MKFAGFTGLCLCVACASAPITSAPVASRAPVSQPPAAAAASEIVAVPNARQAISGVTTGGKPTEAQLQQAKDIGYRTVISLLPSAEALGEAEAVQTLGMKFISIPIPDASALTEENARRLAAAMDAPDAKPLLLHCASGNRAGALLALKAFYVDSVTPAEALDLGLRAGMTSLHPQVEAKMQQEQR
jgi:protein tyrosine phosphatase (PTP) superfamily phosphohydrolase (DUF442 family)